MRVRGFFVIAVLAGAGCKTPAIEPLAQIDPSSARRLFLAPFEREPRGGPSSAARVGESIEGQVRRGLRAQGHQLVNAASEAEIEVSIGAAFQFHPAGDVRTIRLFLRVEENDRWLEDWAGEPVAFHFLPPSEADLEALSRELLGRISSAVATSTRSR